MADIPSKSFATQLGMGSANPVTERFEFISCGLIGKTVLVRSDGVRGTRSRYAHRSRKVQEFCSGPIVLNPSVTELDRLWSRILGGVTAAGVTDIADVLTAFFVAVDKIQKVPVYSGVVVSKATISGTVGQPLQLLLDLEGTGETEGAAGTFPALSIDTQNMFIFADIILILNGITTSVQTISLSIDNLVDKNRFMNSITRAQMPALDRDVSLDVTIPYNPDTHPIYTTLKAGTGFDGSLAFNDGTTTYTADFGELQSNVDAPQIEGKPTEILLPLSFSSLRTASATELKITKTP